MKLNSIVNRYIFRELFPIFFVSIVFFLFLFLMARMLYIVNLVMNYNLSFTAVMMIILLTLPSFLTYILPLSVMMSVLLTTLRLSGDNEILALKTSGLSLYQLLPPVLAFCVLGLAITMVMTIIVIPRTQGMLLSTMTQQMAANANIGLKEQTFNAGIDNVVIYAGQFEPSDGTMRNVFIEDKSNPEMSVTITAPRGVLRTDEQAQVVSLVLFDGEILQTNVKNKTANDMKFTQFELHYDLKEMLGELDRADNERSRREMSVKELRDTIELTANLKNKTYYRAMVALADRFSMPFACLCLGVLVFALGAQLQVNRKSFGLLLGFIFFLLYYVLYSMGHSMAKKGQIDPWLGSWLPNIVIAVLAIYFLVQVAREKELWINKMLLKLHTYMISFGKQA